MYMVDEVGKPLEHQIDLLSQRIRSESPGGPKEETDENRNNAGNDRVEGEVEKQVRRSGVTEPEDISALEGEKGYRTCGPCKLQYGFPKGFFFGRQLEAF
jgi:hypothetical protein